MITDPYGLSVFEGFFLKKLHCNIISQKLVIVDVFGDVSKI